MMSSATESALQEGRIGHTRMKNRIFRAAHTTNLGDAGRIGDRFINYHRERARGGVALSILEIAAVHPTSPGGIFAWDDGVIAGYRAFADTMRPYGMKTFQQLWHGGFGRLPADGSPPMAPSPLAVPRFDTVAREMTQADIDELVQAFAAAAKRTRQGGLDGCEIHAGHSYLVQQFLSPLTNHRNDRYGGSLENRMRFCIEILEAIRSAVGSDFPVGVRLSDEDTPGGLTAEDNNKIARILETLGLIDFLDISFGSYYSFSRTVGGMHEPAGYELPSARIIGEGISVPRMVTGRLRSLEEAGAVIAAGDAEFVSLTRALIADPELMTKSIDGRVDEVRPCIGCNQLCIGGLHGKRGYLGCTVNPEVGQELATPSAPSARPNSRRVVVVGGGPAGLEAARSAALRGHRVVLFEARERLGGAVLSASSAPTRAPLADIVRWQAREIARLGVDIRTGTATTSTAVLAESPDVVILATGARPRTDGWTASAPGIPTAGVDLPHVMTAAEAIAFDPSRTTATTAIVYDDIGHYEAIAAAEQLAAGGLHVTFITRHSGIAPLLETAMMIEPAMKRLRQLAFDLVPRARLDTIAEGLCKIAYLEGGPVFEIPADRVVFVGYKLPDTSLRDALEGQVELHVVGDALSPRVLENAIGDGYRVGNSV